MPVFSVAVTAASTSKPISPTNWFCGSVAASAPSASRAPAMNQAVATTAVIQYGASAGTGIPPQTWRQVHTTATHPAEAANTWLGTGSRHERKVLRQHCFGFRS